MFHNIAVLVTRPDGIFYDVKPTDPILIRGIFDIFSVPRVFHFSAVTWPIQTWPVPVLIGSGSGTGNGLRNCFFVETHALLVALKYLGRHKLQKRSGFDVLLGCLKYQLPYCLNKPEIRLNVPPSIDRQYTTDQPSKGPFPSTVVQ